MQEHGIFIAKVPWIEEEGRDECIIIKSWNVPDWTAPEVKA